MNEVTIEHDVNYYHEVELSAAKFIVEYVDVWKNHRPPPFNLQDEAIEDAKSILKDPKYGTCLDSMMRFITQSAIDGCAASTDFLQKINWEDITIPDPLGWTNMEVCALKDDCPAVDISDGAYSIYDTPKK